MYIHALFHFVITFSNQKSKTWVLIFVCLRNWREKGYPNKQTEQSESSKSRSKEDREARRIGSSGYRGLGWTVRVKIHKDVKGTMYYENNEAIEPWQWDVSQVYIPYKNYCPQPFIIPFSWISSDMSSYSHMKLKIGRKLSYDELQIW